MNRIWLAGFSMLLLLAGCNSSDELVSADKLSPQAKTFLSMRNGGETAERSSQSLAMGRSFTGMFGRGATRMNDTTVVSNDPWQWQTCAVITESIGEDGTYSATYDYGDGCEEGFEGFSYWMYGKFMITYLQNVTETENSYAENYYSDVSYDNYGGSYSYDGVEYEWQLDGESTYEGESSYNWENGQYNGKYSYSSDMEYLYNNEVYSYLAEGNAEYNEKRSITLSGRNNYSYGENYYNSEVLQPLVYKNTCNEHNNFNRYVSTYVSGREQINYSQDGEEGSFIIDYGDGECDNIIYIIEDGKRKKVDLGEFWRAEPMTTASDRK